MQRLLAILLVLIGVIGLVLGRLGETTWAPATEVTATAELADAGPAVVIDPGVLYIGGKEGTVTVTGASDVSVITAPEGDVTAYLDGTKYTRITGASDWSTLTTEVVGADGATEIEDPTSSDLWRSVETSASPVTIDVADFAAAETGDDEQEYRPILLVTDGKSAGAETVSITWPVEAENRWVPFAYAGGAAIAVIGLVLLVVSLGGGRRRDEEIEDADHADDADRAVTAGSAGGAGDAGEAGDVDDAATTDGDASAEGGKSVAAADPTEELPRTEDGGTSLAPTSSGAAGAAGAATAASDRTPPTAPTAPEAPASADDADLWSVVDEDQRRAESPEEDR